MTLKLSHRGAPKFNFQQVGRKYYFVSTSSGVVAADFQVNTSFNQAGLIVTQDRGSSANMQHYLF